MEGLHDATGSVALWLVIGLSVTGLAMLKYKYLRQYANIPRQRLFQAHKIGIFVLIAFVITHILTTKNFNPYLFIGTGVIVPVIVFGALYRVKSLKAKHFNNIAYVKIGILALCLIFLTVGHNIAEKNRHKISTISE